MGLVLVTPPDQEPLTPAEAIDHLRVTDDAEGALIQSLVQAAREMVEGNTGRALVTQTWRLTLDRFPPCSSNPIRLPKPPVQSVASVQYVDVDGVTRTWEPAEYQLDLTDVTPRLRPAYGKAWPSTRCQMNAVTVEFMAGYGGPSQVPEGIKAAMKLLLGHWHENRESSISGTIINDIPLGYDTLVWRYRVLEFS